MNKSEVLQRVKDRESEVMETIDDLKGDYLDSDWEYEFDDIHEAYEEQGRGQAESQAVQEAVYFEDPDISDDDLCWVMDEIASEWCISYN